MRIPLVWPFAAKTESRDSALNCAFFPLVVAGFAGDGITCTPCRLGVSVPYASFSNSELPRGAPSTIYGEAARQGKLLTDEHHSALSFSLSVSRSCDWGLLTAACELPPVFPSRRFCGDPNAE